MNIPAILIAYLPLIACKAQRLLQDPNVRRAIQEAAKKAAETVVKAVR